MKTVLITGGTGMLGTALIEQILLSQHNWTIYVLYRTQKSVDELNVVINKAGLGDNHMEYVRGDIMEYEALSKTVPDGLDVVFHMAAATSQWSGDNDLLVKINVEGTNNIIKFCLEKKVKKLVYTSSISAYAPPDGAVVSEKSPKLGEHHISYYNKTKFWSEENVLRAVREKGLQACITNPTQVLGKYDNASWAQFFRAIIHNQLPMLGRGGGCMASLTEVAKAHIVAAEKGRNGENYILGGPSRSYLQLATEINKLRGLPCNLKVAPDFVIRSLAKGMDWYSYYWSQSKPLLTPENAERFCRAYSTDCTKARTELGYNDEVPFEELVLEEYRWVTQR